MTDPIYIYSDMFSKKTLTLHRMTKILVWFKLKVFEGKILHITQNTYKFSFHTIEKCC